MHKKRSDLKARLRKERGKLRRSNKEINKLVGQLNRAKRKAENTIKQYDAWQLRNESQSKRRAFLAAQNRLLRDNPQLVDLREQIGKTARQIKRQRKRIQHARKQNAEEFLLDGELVEPELGSFDVETI